MKIKLFVKRGLLRHKKCIIIDKESDINFNVLNNSINPKYPCLIVKSNCSLEIVNEGCNISEAICVGNIILGRFVSILGPGTVIKSVMEKIQIGSFSSIGQNVSILDFNHLYKRITSSFIHHLIFKENFIADISTKGPVIIGEDVWIGSNSVILSGVKIGRGAVIGAGSIVTKDIPQYSIAVGNPAAVISKRFDDSIIEYLEKLKWWEWDIQRIFRNRELFNVNLNELNIHEIENIIRQ